MRRLLAIGLGLCLGGCGRRCSSMGLSGRAGRPIATGLPRRVRLTPQAAGASLAAGAAVFGSHGSRLIRRPPMEANVTILLLSAGTAIAFCVAWTATKIWRP